MAWENDVPLETVGDRCEPLGADGMWTKRGPSPPAREASAGTSEVTGTGDRGNSDTAQGGDATDTMGSATRREEGLTIVHRRAMTFS